MEQFEKDLSMKVANAGRVIEKSLESMPGDLPEFIQEIIKAHTEPQKTYKDLIADVLEAVTRDDYSWGRPNRKYDDFYIPTLYQKSYNIVVIIIDTSGSISRKELETYAAEVSGILQEFPGFEIKVIFHNTRAYRMDEYSIEDLPIEFKNTQSGGTCYRDVYAKVNELEDEPVAIFHFTDLEVGERNYPDRPPEGQTFWMNTRKGRLFSTPPFGEVVRLDII